MKNKDYFDNVLKSVIDDSVSNIESSRDVFNEAWNEKEKEMSKRKYFRIKYIKKVALVPACCAVFSLVGVFTFSPATRVAAQEALRTIFVLDKSDKDVKVVEKSEDQILEHENFGTVKVTSSNKKHMEKIFGFSFYLPEKIGEYSVEKLGNYNEDLYPIAGIAVYDIKYKDAQELNKKFAKAIDDDETFEELKDYKMKRIIGSVYVDNQGHRFNLYLSKYSEGSKMNLVKEVNIDNIKCRILEKTAANYQQKVSENCWSNDMTKEPTSVDKQYYMKWNYDGVEYSIHIGKDSDVDAATQFAGEYIKSLKQE